MVTDMRPCYFITCFFFSGGPWVLWDDLATGIRKTADLGFSAIELFTEGPSAATQVS